MQTKPNQTEPIQSKYTKKNILIFLFFFILQKKGKKGENCEREKSITTEKHTENMHKQ